MIVCHCNVLSEKQIRGVVRDLLRDDPYRVIVPGLTLRMAGCRGKCCNCFPRLAELIAETVDTCREDAAKTEAEPEAENEGRPESHRAA